MPIDACCAQSDTHCMSNKKIVIPKAFGSMAAVLKRTQWCQCKIANATKHPADRRLLCPERHTPHEQQEKKYTKNVWIDGCCAETHTMLSM
jgi:hypothetical protein